MGWKRCAQGFDARAAGARALSERGAELVDAAMIKRK